MKKEPGPKSILFLKLTTFFVVVIMFFGVLTPRAYAGVCEDTNNVVLKWLYKMKTFCTISRVIHGEMTIAETVDNIIYQLLTGTTFSVALNMNADDYSTCSLYMLDQAAQNIRDQSGNVVGSPNWFSTNEFSPGGTQLVEQEAIDYVRRVGPGLMCNTNDLGNERIAGSFGGVTMYAYNTVSSSPPPVSLAYYAHHNLQKIPVVRNTALAQNVAYSFGPMGLEMVMTIWETFRNLAYGMMSVIMLIIGIMITTRRKINPHAVVTAQAALPRVVISLLLITFSYPIGAIIASMSIPLAWLVIKIFVIEHVEAVIEAFAGLPGQLFSMNALISILALLGVALGSSTIGVAIVSILLLLTLVSLAVAAIKILLINIKMMLMIVTAPIQFAVAAIPGQEHIITDWFKNMLAKALSIPAIMFMIALGWFVLLAPFRSVGNFNTIVTGGGPLVTLFTFGRLISSTAISLMMLPLVSMMLMFSSLKIDKKVDEFITGDTGKRKRK